MNMIHNILSEIYHKKQKPIIKICGNRDHDNALLVASFKPDFMGWIFSPVSKRKAEPETVKDTIKKIKDLHPEILHVGVFAENSLEEVIYITSYLNIELDFLQVVGSAHFIKELRKKISAEVIPVVRPTAKISKELFIETYPSPFWILDTYDPNTKGGTGKSIPLEFFGDKIDFPFLIAGGLHKDNFIKYIELSGALGIDINSGIEDMPGVKSEKKLKEFYKIYNTYFAS